jgi:hypothetical protein
MAAHRYWRLQVRGNGGSNYVGVGELQMRTSIGGVNVATGGTASASSTYNTSYTAAKAFDGLTSDTGAGNGWDSASLYNGGDGISGLGSFPWLMYDFGSGNAKDIQEIAIFAPGTGGVAVAELPTAWNFQYSDDNVYWATQRSYAFDASTPAWTLNSSRVYDVRPLGPIDIHNYTLLNKVKAAYTPPRGDPLHPNQTNKPLLGCTLLSQRNWHAGPYKVAGTTTVLGNPAPRRVRLYAQNDGRIYAEQITGPDGLFEFRNLDIGPWTVVGVDDTGTQNGVIFTHINAVPM